MLLHMPARISFGSLFLPVFIGVLPGCTHFEYDIVQPPELVQHIGRDADAVFTRTPLLYRMRSYEDHLVIQVHNPTTQPITLLGGQSFLVDPQGQSRPLRTQTIGPQSFIKLILPPMPPDVAPAGPVIGFGLGAAYRAGPDVGLEYDQPILDRPRYYAAYDADMGYWTWEGESDVRLSLTLAMGNQPPFTQTFVFHRRKMSGG
jgi:hypothetical protein